MSVRRSPRSGCVIGPPGAPSCVRLQDQRNRPIDPTDEEWKGYRAMTARGLGCARPRVGYRAVRDTARLMKPTLRAWPMALKRKRRIWTGHAVWIAPVAQSVRPAEDGRTKRRRSVREPQSGSDRSGNIDSRGNAAEPRVFAYTEWEQCSHEADSTLHRNRTADREPCTSSGGGDCGDRMRCCVP